MGVEDPRRHRKEGRKLPVDREASSAKVLQVYL